MRVARAVRSAAAAAHRSSSRANNAYRSTTINSMNASLRPAQHAQHRAICAGTTTPWAAQRVSAAFTDKVEFVDAWPSIPAVRFMDENGNVVASSLIGKDMGNEDLVSEATCRNFMEHMIRLAEMDRILYDVQRQGRISFYMTSTGEEGLQFGAAAALKPEDIVYTQYREPGVLMWRGFTLEQFCHQCYSNAEDLGKGRQMPVHYGSSKLNFQTVSSPLATQIPQAAGAAYKLMVSGESDRAVVCFFGEGAASEGDFHAAMNFAATLGGPTVFFCRNNGYAISTPAHEQFAGDGVAPRGPAYGMRTIRVDGNDIFAVNVVTAAARKYAVENQRPVFIEALTYRMGHHSTSDDASRYRGTDEPARWSATGPILRLGRFMEQKGWWDANQEKELRKTARKNVLSALKGAEAAPKPPLSELFTDVYDEIPPHLLEQRAQLKAHLEKHGKEYRLDEFVGGGKLD